MVRAKNYLVETAVSWKQNAELLFFVVSQKDRNGRLT